LTHYCKNLGKNLLKLHVVIPVYV